MTASKDSTVNRAGAGDRIKSGVLVMASLIAVMWVLEIVDSLFLDQGLNAYGVHPRTIDGLWGILLAPFLHGGFSHLSANTAPFAVLGLLLYLRGIGDFLGATAIITVLGGLAVWTVGAGNSVHIGASGLIFGYLGFLLLAGFFERSLRGLLVAVLVGFLYGGVLYGVLPGQPGVSWEGHLFGFLAGVAAARLIARRRPARRSPPGA